MRLRRTLTRQLERRFGSLTSALEARIAAATLDELDVALDRALDAEAPEDVFPGRASPT